jgi:hypothetical protein
MRRLLLAVFSFAALVIPAAVFAAVTPAGATTTPPTCGKLTGTVSGTMTVSACSPINANYKSASDKTLNFAGGKGTLTWSPSKKTTTVSITFKKSGTSCPAGSSEYVANGTVTGGTATYTAKGQIVSAKVCLSSTGSLSLVPKTVMHL